MKTLFTTFLFALLILYCSRGMGQKLSKDSTRYYQGQLQKMQKETYDSLRNSESYKTIAGRLKSGKNTENFGVEFSLLLGYQHNNYSNLNARLASLNVKEINGSMSAVGLGLAFRFNKIIIGYDMSALGRKNTSGGYIHIYASTNVLTINRLIISPQIGFGEQNVTYKHNAPSASTGFNEYFTTGPNKVEIEHRNSAADFALAFKMYARHNPRNYVPLFRIGYRYGINEKAWEVKDGNAAGAPADRNNNFYVQLILGFGG